VTATWVFVFDQAFGGTGPEKGAPPSGLGHERISVMGPGSLQLTAHLGPDQPAVTARPGGVDRDGDGKLDLTYFTKRRQWQRHLVGRGGDDVVWGEGGLDQLDGSEGDDEVVGWVDTDPDLVLGGPDNDTCRLGPNDPQPIGCEQII
jgi:hypothetical protein